MDYTSVLNNITTISSTNNNKSSSSSIIDRLFSINQKSLRNRSEVVEHYELLLDGPKQFTVIGFYVLILISGLLFNAAIIWVILGRSNNRTPRNLYTVNLAISGIMVGVFCVPTTMVQVLYGGWWHFGLFACKLVPTIQGANILVSAFTIMAIAIDRWISVTCRNPNDYLRYSHVTMVIFSIWALSFAAMTPVFYYNEIQRMPPDDMIDGHLYVQICQENYPYYSITISMTIFILFIQYVCPLMILPFVHVSIVTFLRKNSGFQNDARRKEREIKRNRRMSMILSCISIIFAVSWLPWHLLLILTDIFNIGMSANNQQTFFFALGLCHCSTMSSIFTNPLIYGWFNTSLRSELESLLPKCCRDCLHRRRRESSGPLTAKIDSTNADLELKVDVNKTSLALIPRREQLEANSPVTKPCLGEKEWV